MAKDAAQKAMDKLQNDDKLNQPAPASAQAPKPAAQPREAESEVQTAAEVAAEETAAPEGETSLIILPEYGTPEKAIGEWVSALGLTLPDNLNWVDYELVGQGIRVFKESGMWIVGDFLNYGIDHFGEDHASQIVDALGYEEGSLAQAKAVSKAIPIGERHQALSWAHHQTVAKFESDARKRWLDQAEENHWTRDDLRDRIRVAEGREKAPRGRRKGTGKTEKVAKARAEAMTVIAMVAFAENQFAPNLLMTMKHMAEFAQLGAPILKSLQAGSGIANTDAKSLLEPIDDLTKKLARLREQAAQIAVFQPPADKSNSAAGKEPKARKAKAKAPRKPRQKKKTTGGATSAAEATPAASEA